MYTTFSLWTYLFMDTYTGSLTWTKCFNQCAKTIQPGKNNLFNNLYWENWLFICKKMKLNLFFMPYTNIN